jgi:hypothetical protein
LGGLLNFCAAPGVHPAYAIESERAKLYAFLVGPDISGNVRRFDTSIFTFGGTREAALRGTYSGLNWFVRAVRLLPVVAVAAALGGLVGGFAVYAVDSALTSALTPQLRPDASADNQSAAPPPQNTPPARIIGGAKPDTSAGTPGPAPALQPKPAPQQKPQPGSTPLPQSILAAKPLGPASQFQPPAATPAQAASGIAQQLKSKFVTVPRCA